MIRIILGMLTALVAASAVGVPGNNDLVVLTIALVGAGLVMWGLIDNR